MRKQLTMNKVISWVLLGNVVYGLSQWLIIVIIAKLGSLEMLGQFTLALAVVSPVILFSNFQLKTIIAIDSDKRLLFSNLLFIRLITVGLAFLTVLIISFTFGYDGITTTIIIIVCLSKACESLSDLTYGVFQREERMDISSKSIIIKSILIPLIVGTMMWYTGNILYGVIGFGLVWLLILFTYDLAHIRRFSMIEVRYNRVVIKQTLLIGLPLSLAVLGSSLSVHIPRFIIERFMSLEELGYFAGLAYIVAAGGLVVSAVGQSSLTRLSNYFALGQWKKVIQLINRMLALSLSLGVIGLIVVIWAGDSILSLLYSNHFVQDDNVFFWIMLGGCIGYVSSIFGYALTAANRIKIQVPIYYSFLLLIIVLSLLLIPRYGLLGAAWSICICYSLQVPIQLLITYYSITECRARAGVQNE